MTEHDSALEAVFSHLMGFDSVDSQMGKAVRRTFDMLLDGQHTGRYRCEQLHKTEKNALRDTDRDQLAARVRFCGLRGA
ncbi:NaeI family type II restriction endonuclease [Nonomuraea basaltis]|uniref:NaeI family type II restriction endonuclease n=1 Tax=Nonomuraea basaltis TaxID=2495887 RepID=UPI003B846AA2